MLLKNTKYINFLLVLFHVLIGYLSSVEIISKIYGVAIFGLGAIIIFFTKNKGEQAPLWSGYIVGLEVFLRITGGSLFYEFSKYSVILFLLLGLLIEKRQHKVPLVYMIYIILLIFGIAFVDVAEVENLRQEISFNLSGPLVLGISAIYFYQRNYSLLQIKKLLAAVVFPIVSILSYLYFHTPKLTDISFYSGANFEASGGFGPNQVATILGFGFFAMFVLLLINKRLSGFKILDLFILGFIIFRGFLTFSRGGMLTGFIAILTFGVFYFLATRYSFFKLIQRVAIICIAGVVFWSYISDVTGGIIDYRYTGKNTLGEEKADITSGRLGYFSDELEAFYKSPIFGIGVGGSKAYRNRNSVHTGSTHNEITRLLSEHGLVGIAMLLMLIIVPIVHRSGLSLLGKAFCSSFLILWFLTINHSAMRVAFPGFIYGLSLINFNDKLTLHRK